MIKETSFFNVNEREEAIEEAYQYSHYNTKIVDKYNKKEFDSVLKQTDEIEKSVGMKLEKIDPFLILALTKDSSDFFEYYLSKHKNLDLNIKDPEVENSNLLGMALELDLTSIFYTLEDHGAKLETDSDNVLPICAARNGNLEVLKYLIQNQQLDINKNDSNGNNVLHEAIGYKHEKVIDFILANNNFKKEKYLESNKNGETPKQFFESLKNKNIFTEKTINLIEKLEDIKVKKKFKMK